MDTSNPPTPRNAVVVLLDSLNRHLVGAYGAREFATPNLDRFARRAVRFDTHYAGSLPCMPARHDLLCGALDFLWKPWGSIELWEEPITVALRRAGVTSMLVSDHPHLFEVGGENYHCDFSAWDYQRGHESDPWRTRPDPSWVGAPSLRPRPHALRRLARLLPRRGRLPGPAHARRGGALARARRAAPRALPPVRGRVRSARAVRHARAVRVDVRPGVGGPAPDLAAVYTRGCRGRSTDGAPGAAAPRLLRRASSP